MSFAAVTHNSKTQSPNHTHQASGSDSFRSSSAEKKHFSMDSLKKLKWFTKTKGEGDGGSAVPLQIRSAQHTHGRKHQPAHHHKRVSRSPVDLLECVDGIEMNTKHVLQKDEEIKGLTERCETQYQQIKTLEKQVADLSEQAKQFESECCVEGEENKALKCEIERLRHQLDTQTSISFLEDTNCEEETIANYKRALTTLKKQIGNFNDDMAKLRDHSKEQSRQILKLRQQAEMTGLMESQIKSEVAIRQKAEEESERLHEELEKARIMVNTLQTERKVLDAELKAMKEESARFIKDQVELNDLRKNHATLLDEHEQVLKSMRAMGALSAQLAESEKSVRTLERQLESIKLAHGNLQAASAQKEGRNHGIDHSKITGQKKTAAHSKRNIQQDICTHQEDYEGIKKLLVEHQESLSAIELLNEKLTKEVHLGREKCQGLEQDMQAKSSQVKQYAKEVERLKRQIAAQSSGQAAGNTSTRAHSLLDETQRSTGIAKLNELYKTSQDDNERLSSENLEFYNEIEELKRVNTHLVEQLRVSNKVQGEDYGHEIQARLPPEGVPQVVSSSTSPTNENQGTPSKTQQASSIESQQVFSAPLQVASHTPDTASTSQSLPDQFTGISTDNSVMQQANSTHECHLAPFSKAEISPKPLHREPISDEHEVAHNIMVSESPCQPSPLVGDSINHGEVASVEDSITQFENPLVKELDNEIHQQAAEVIQEVSGGRQEVKTDLQRPFDPNLICPMCRRQFRIGEIQKFKRHVNTCTGTND